MATVARTPDAELLTRLRTRDRAAWEELYVIYQPRLRGFAYRLAGNAHDADDLVQETFVRAVPRLDKLDPGTADVGAYLFTTMRNLYLKQVERERRQQPVAEVPEPAVQAPIEDDPVRSTLLVRQQEEVRRANGKLQPRQRLVLALRELEDRSYAEIGELVGMKENAVAQLIFRARESLRTELRLLQVDPEKLPEECRRYLPLLAAHLDGQLKGAKRDETLAHLEGCARCQAALADMREASRRYRTLFPPIAADEGRAAIDERLTSAGYWDSRGRLRFGARALGIAAVVALGVLLATGGTVLGITLAREDPVAASATTTPSPTTTTSEASEVTEPPTTTERSTRSQPTTTTSDPTTTAPTETTEPTTEQTSTGQPSVTTGPTPASTRPPAEPTVTEPGTTTPPPPPPDTTAPVVRFTRAPASTTQTPTAQIAFTSSERDATFSCRLDAAPYASCKSPVSLTNLAAGGHTFSVRAKDEAGNVGTASATWTFTPPDTTPPLVTILSAPATSTTERDATFTFSSNEPGSTFACSLDSAAFAPCSSGISFQRLATGTHVFSVRATDQAGNTGPPAIHTWTIFVQRPDLVVSAFAQLSITVSNRGNAPAGPADVQVTLVSTALNFKTPTLAPGQSVTFSWSICRVGTYRAIVDRTQVVVESDETNNTATRQNTCVRG
jgi:RNA polymerase sigma factor (sigma-70 family)